MSDKYPIVPGRGLLTQQSIQARIDYLIEQNHGLSAIINSSLDYHTLQHNIESYIGTIELPIGLVGPLYFKENGIKEQVYTLVGTLEGALVASMNRGAKAISLSGGFEANVIHQRMVRCPMFFLENKIQALQLAEWVITKQQEIKKCVESYSNFAILKDLDIHVRNNILHLSFIYTTGDASGQNMTTTCTWHGILWIQEHFSRETNINIQDVIIEGNGASDKKVSRYLIDEGRGCKVIASCELEEDVIKKVLRTTSEDFIKSYVPSLERVKEIGMLAFNINVANAIAAIFASTGQDLASIHESSVAQLDIAKSDKGLKLTLTLPSLVVGTVGGGTHLADRKEVLKLMGCTGKNSVDRFAKLIAGFSLALEISTFAAIISGEFAKAHEKLGRNKPIKHFELNEITSEFITKGFYTSLPNKIKQISFLKNETEKGILTLLSQKVSKNHQGFIPLDLILSNHSTIPLILKNKSIDTVVIRGLQSLAASVNFKLANLITTYRKNIEYADCHHKELKVYKWLEKQKLNISPTCYGELIQDDREIYLLFLERLNFDDLAIFDSENKPELWSVSQLKEIFNAIHTFHTKAAVDNSFMTAINSFKTREIKPLYDALLQITKDELEEQDSNKFISNFEDYFSKDEILIPNTVIHNDFNPRNCAIDKNRKVLIYDWELAVQGLPQRDIVEFLAFVADKKSDDEIMELFHFHENIARLDFGVENESIWWKGYKQELQKFLLTRASFYVAANVAFEIKFSHRIVKNSLRLIDLIQLKLNECET